MFYYIKTIISDILNNITNVQNHFLDSYLLHLQLLSKNTFNTFILCDNLFIGSVFLYNYIFKNKLFKQSIYILPTLERYFIYNCLNIIHKNNDIFYLFIIPNIQNFIVLMYPFNKIYKLYNKYKIIFINYFISKFIIKYIESLHPQINLIKNYNIFELYKFIDYNFILNCFKNTLFIIILNILRNINSTYYYYKAIKFAYYQNVGYMYNILSLNNSIFIINKIIKEKRWNELSNIEIINALYTLTISKYQFHFTNIEFSFYILIYSIFSISPFITLSKLILHTNINLYYLIIFNISFCLFLNNKLKYILFNILIYNLLYLDINDIIISIIIIKYDYVYYIIKELIFFIYNINNISKIIHKFELIKNKKIMENIKYNYQII